jgi:hypothetical protein
MWLHYLKILVDVQPEERADVMKELIRKNHRPLRIVKGFATGVPVTPGECDLFTFIPEERFRRMEQLGEFVHIDELDGMRCAYRFPDMEKAVSDSDVLIVLHEFDIDEFRRDIFRLKSVKKLIDRNGEIVPLPDRPGGAMRECCNPAD